MSWLIKEAIHALDSVIGGHGLAHCGVTVKVVSESEPLVLQEPDKFSGHILGLLAWIILEAGKGAWPQGQSRI